MVQGNSTLGVCGVKSKIGVVCSLILRFRYDLEKYFSIDTSLPPPARLSLTQAVLGLSRLARQCWLSARRLKKSFELDPNVSLNN